MLRLQQICASLIILLAILCGLGTAARAVEPVSITKDVTALDISRTGTWYRDVDGSLKISTAPDRDGIVRRVEISPKNPGGTSNWYVFALANDSSEQIDRLIVAPHYRLVGAGLIWPDLDSERIAAITPSEGFSLEAVDDREADTEDTDGGVTKEIAALQVPQEGTYLVSVSSNSAGTLSQPRLTFGLSPLGAVTHRFEDVVDELKGPTGIIVLIALGALMLAPRISRAMER